MQDQVSLGLFLVFAQEWLKKQPWFPWLDYEKSRANNWFSIIVSGLGTIGISIAHTGSFQAGGTLLITIPAGSVLLAGIWHCAQQYLISKGFYKLLIVPSTPTTPQNSKL